MEWIPIVFVIFKVLVLVTGMFFAVKWHYDQGKKHPDKRKEMRSMLRGGVLVAVIFVVALAILGFVTFELINLLGM